MTIEDHLMLVDVSTNRLSDVLCIQALHRGNVARQRVKSMKRECPVPLLHLQRTVKLSVGGPNSTVESLPPLIRNIHTSTNREVSDHCTRLSCYQTIIDTANLLEANRLDDETVHRHGPPDALVPKDYIWCWLYAHFEPSSKFTGSNKFVRMLEMDETGKLKHQCWERLINLIVKCVGANDYDMCRFRALFLSSIGTGNRFCITCPSDSHSNNSKRPHFEALCDETFAATREMHQSIMAETPVRAIGVFGAMPHKIFLTGHKALNSSIITKEVQNQCDVIQEEVLPHMERQNNLLHKEEQLRLGKWIERLLQFALDDPNIRVTEKMLDEFVRCTSKEKHREGCKKGAEKSLISLKTTSGINRAARMVQKGSGVSSELAEEIVENRRSSGATKISHQIVAGSITGAKNSAAAAARHDQETGKFYCNACGGLPSACDGETFGDGRYNRPHQACTKKPQGHFCLTKVSEEVKVDILQRAYCDGCSHTGLLNGRHVCSGNGGSAFTSLTAPSNFDMNDMGSGSVVMKFRVEEGSEELVPVDSWRAVGKKSKSSGKTCLEDVVQTAEAVKTKTLETKSDLLKSLDKSNHWAFNSRREKIVVRAAGKALLDYMNDIIKGENNLHDVELRLGNYVYRGVKIVPPSQE